MRPTYLWTSFFAFKGLLMLGANAFVPDPAALWCGVGSLLVGVPLFAVLEHLGRGA